jgi:DHA1 family bicyclomycin/chloramphenicol resistance-like MFS transporter
MVGSLALVETLEKRHEGSLISTLGRLRVVLSNRQFAFMLVLFSLISMSSLAFVASSSYIYVVGFGLDERTYSYFFALNATGLVLAPIAYIFLSRRYDIRPIIMICFLTIALAGLVVCLFGRLGPLAFALALLPATFSGSLTRAPGTNLMLEQQRTDTGSAASLISCSSVLMGSVGMSVMSLGWSDLVVVLGAMNVLTGSTCLVMWRYSSRPVVARS